MDTARRACRWVTGLTSLAVLATGLCRGAEPSPEQFADPPAAARPWVYWFALNGNITPAGITADLEAMARVGIGGVLYMEVDQGTPKGPVAFGSDAWHGLMAHAFREADRLGLEFNMNNDAGWCGSGGPWITPELSMQRVVWSETAITGPQHVVAKLPQPEAAKGYYRDIAVFAYPAPARQVRLPHLRGKTLAERQEVALRTAYPELPATAVVPRGSIVDLTPRVAADGRLDWEAPAGAWTVLRLGHTTTGRTNHPAPDAGRGLECDKLSREAVATHFRHLVGKLAADNPGLSGRGRAFVRTHIDSWEVGSQNWTPRFRQEFRRLRGYDPLLLLPVLSGCVVDTAEISERFLWDVRVTIAELLLQNYAGQLRDLARGCGLELSIEAYGDGPFDDLAFAGQADEPMSEFWSWSRFGGASSCLEMASAAHVYGRPIHGAEAFTATDAEKWLGHPGNIKDLGDWAFCAGVNRFVFHRYALQPWTRPDRAPGMSMGPWGLHYERTQTWWPQSHAWHAYLSRCQYLLQQGLFVADLCFLLPENAPQGFHAPAQGGESQPGYRFDSCPADVVLTRMAVQGGRIVLPDGMSYRLLVLPRVARMTPRLLRRIRDLVEAGATVLGDPPVGSPSLDGYPQCDEEVRQLARGLWGDGQPPDVLAARAVGKGRVLWGRELQPPPDPEYDPGAAVGAATWIWFDEGQPAAGAPPGARYFRRVLDLPGDQRIASARLAMTADNEFECWINGRRAGQGDDWQRLYAMGVGHLLKSGPNVIAVAARNTTDSPTPAGLVAALTVRYADGRTLDMVTDGAWEAAQTAPDRWQSAMTPAGWSPARVLGPMGMRPWGELDLPPAVPRTTVDLATVNRVLEGLGVPPDLSCAANGQPSRVRFIHKRTGTADIYFVANAEPVCRELVCTFRVEGKRPEFWHPDTGLTEPAVVFEPVSGGTRLPLRLAPFESVFVVFRQPLAGVDPVVALTRDGEPLLPTPPGRRELRVQKALYGLLNDPAARRDVTAKVQALFAQGTLTFPVAEMARGDDPAFGQVKTLRIDYTADGEPFSASSTDGQTIAVSPPAPPLAARLLAGPDGAVVLEASQAGRYALRTASGKALTAEVAAVPPGRELEGEWAVEFPVGGGAPDRITLPRLISWSDHPDQGVKYFSGTATYGKTFDLPETMLDADRRIILDLGKVEVMAEVILNGQSFGVLWKAPFRVDVTRGLRAGRNALQVNVTNLWINRMIGDEQLPEDSDRLGHGTLKDWPAWLAEAKPSPSGRHTFATWRLWRKDDPLVPSGLIGPVALRITPRTTPK